MEDARESHTHKKKRLRGEERIRKAKLPTPQFSQAKDMFVVFNPLRGHKCVTFDQVLVHICELACMADYHFLMQEQKWCLTFDVLSLVWVSADITPSKVSSTHSCFPESEDWTATPSWSSHINPERAWRASQEATVIDNL